MVSEAQSIIAKRNSGWDRYVLGGGIVTTGNRKKKPKKPEAGQTIIVKRLCSMVRPHINLSQNFPEPAGDLLGTKCSNIVIHIKPMTFT